MVNYKKLLLKRKCVAKSFYALLSARKKTLLQHFEQRNTVRSDPAI